MPAKKGVKRKADTTTPVSSSPAAVMHSTPAYRSTSSSVAVTTPASIATRRESRTVKRPKKDLDDDIVQHSSNKSKKEPLSESLKYCGVILRELFSKKHAVSTVVSCCITSLDGRLGGVVVRASE